MVAPGGSSGRDWGPQPELSWVGEMAKGRGGGDWSQVGSQADPEYTQRLGRVTKWQRGILRWHLKSLKAPL